LGTGTGANGALVRPQSLLWCVSFSRSPAPPTITNKLACAFQSRPLAIPPFIRVGPTCAGARLSRRRQPESHKSPAGGILAKDSLNHQEPSVNLNHLSLNKACVFGTEKDHDIRNVG
jgi:hypothetical protein